MADIFLSYASADRDRAQRLASVLESQGWSVWWDRTIPPGSTFDEVIERALESARCVVVLWSRASVASDWVKTEAADGARRRILVPALIEGARIPLEFRRLQAADLSGWQGEPDHRELTTLFRSISDRLAQPLPPSVTTSEPAALAEDSQPPERRPLPSPPPTEPGARKRMLGLLAVLIAILLAAVGGATALWWRPQTSSPDVVGIRAERAKSMIKAVGLEVGKEESRETEGSPPGTVVAQNPPAGQRIRKGEAVDLVVALTPRVTVPSLRGQTLERAGSALKTSGLTVGATSAKVTDEARPGTVLAQRPEAGARVDKGTSVDLQVAARETVEVPNLVGEALARVKELLTQAGLTIGRRDVKTSDDVKPGVVLSQSPAAGERVARGQEINLVIATHPTVRVPDVIGLPVRDAQARLEGAGLATGAVDRMQTGDRAPGTVVRQRPGAGDAVEKGRPVDLTIAAALPPEPTPTGTTIAVPDVVKKTARDAVAAIERAGLVARLRHLETDRAPAGTVLSQRPRAGSQLDKGDGVDLTAAVAAPGPDAAGNEIKGFTWRDVSRTGVQFKLVYTYKGTQGESGVTIVALPIDASGRIPPDFERIEQPVSVGTGTVELKITRRPGASPVTTRSVRVCMSSRERRVSVLCRTYAFAKTWG